MAPDTAFTKMVRLPCGARPGRTDLKGGCKSREPAFARVPVVEPVPAVGRKAAEGAWKATLLCECRRAKMTSAERLN